ncbi:beta-lactamase/transpeptidase-like protein [Xylariomycetidae sp. FL2044]|nr:beta-lactamase/transpeptidase-like protein [Xylariomycetidae sp. FL2044]
MAITRHEREAGSLTKRLSSLNNTIRKLMRIAGAAGLSLGVQFMGEAPYFANFGFRDVKNQLEVDEKTIYNACSLTKFFLAMTMARVADDPSNSLSWDSLVSQVLPGFEIEDATIRDNLSITDLLTHGSGLSTGPNRRPFRQRWNYNNVSYEAAGLVIDHFTGSWSRKASEELLEPLGMRRSSFFRPLDGDNNVAKAYGTLNNGDPVEISTPAVDAGSVVGGPGGGLFTCVEDLLKAYTAAMEAFKDQMVTGRTETEGCPIRMAAELLSAKIPMLQPTYRELSYAVGMCRVQLPGQMGHIGDNMNLMPRMSIVGKGAPSTLVFYHQGSRPGVLCAMAMIPELDASIVVMSSSLGLNDCPDWVLQLVIEEILAVPDRNDFEQAAKQSAVASYRWYNETRVALDRERMSDRPLTRPLEAYVGVYWNKRRYQKIDVSLDTEGRLFWALEGLEAEKYELEHYENDTFLWLKPRDYLVSRGRWVGQPPNYWKLKFVADEDGEIRMVNWLYDASVPENGNYFKD